MKRNYNILSADNWTRKVSYSLLLFLTNAVTSYLLQQCGSLYISTVSTNDLSPSTSLFTIFTLSARARAHARAITIINEAVHDLAASSINAQTDYAGLVRVRKLAALLSIRRRNWPMQRRRRLRSIAVARFFLAWVSDSSGRRDAMRRDAPRRAGEPPRLTRIVLSDKLHRTNRRAMDG